MSQLLRRIGTRMIAVGLIVVIGATACSSDEEASLGSDSDGLGVVGPVAPPSAFEDLWAEYLAVYDRVLSDSGSADGLSDFATDSVVTELEALGQANRTKVEDIEFDGIVEVTSSANVISLDEGAQPTLTDCTTHTIQSVIGDPFEIFASREVSFETDVTGKWVISEVDVLQDGWFGATFGCVPAAYADEARRVAALFQDYGLELERDPRQPLPQGLIDISSDEVEEAMVGARAALIDFDLYTDSVGDVFQVVVGLNFQFASVEGPVVRVESCVTYPEGQELRVIDSGEVSEQALPPGGSQGTSIDVIVRDGFVGQVIAITPASEGTC